MTRNEHQAVRRANARARGDCGVCCRRPAQPGRFRCVMCDAYRQSETGRIPSGDCGHCGRAKAVHDYHACAVANREQCGARYRRLRAAGLCVHCAEPSGFYVSCLECRRVRRIKANMRSAEVRAGERRVA